MQLDVEAAAWYLACASSVSYARYHLVGQQPIVEKQRLTEANEEVVSAGQLGEEDGMIQYQVQQSNYRLINNSRTPTKNKSTACGNVGPDSIS